MPIYRLSQAEFRAWREHETRAELTLTKCSEEGFELYTGRRPEPHDFIVPNSSRRRGSVNHSRSSYYKSFIKYAEVAGVRPRSLHSTRHTCASAALFEAELAKRNQG